jgi:psiF repeat
MKKIVAVLSVPVACFVLCGPIAVSAAEGTKHLTAQQQRMKDCNKEAGKKKLSGAERKAFMKECLSTKSHATGSTEAPRPQGQ